MQRIGDEIQRELAQLLHTKTNDPRLHSLSITAVQVSPDMANATVLISTLQEDNLKETLAALSHASGFFRRALAHALNLRVTPRLHFAHDKSISQANRLAALLYAVNITDKEPPKDA
jgi:ribosome-binding factor A